MRYIEATKPLIVVPTQADVNKGIQEDKGCCVFAQSCHRETPDMLKVEIGVTIVSTIEEGKVTRYKTSPEAAAAIKKFDKTGVWTLGTDKPVVLGLPMPKYLTRKAGQERVQAARAAGTGGLWTGEGPKKKHKKRMFDPRNVKFLQTQRQRTAAAA